MREGLFEKSYSSIRAVSVTATVAAMDYVLILVLIVAASLFVVGMTFVSLPVGLLLALTGSVVILYAYISFCQIFADHRGARHV